MISSSDTLHGKILIVDHQPANVRLLGLLNGALVGLVAAFCMYVVATVKHMPNALMLGVVVFLAMISSWVISGALGAVVPLVLKKLGADS